MARRPYRATVYLPGHGEDGTLIVVARVSAGSEDGLDRALARWLAQGYEARRWEELELPLTGENDGSPET